MERNNWTRDKRYVVGAAKLLYAIEYLGRYCACCKFDGFLEPWFMDFHHRDPAKKEFCVKNKVMHGEFSRFKKEIDKCELLCGQCHRKLHARTDLYSKHSDKIESKLQHLRENKGVFCNKTFLTDTQIKEMRCLAKDGKSRKEICKLTGLNYDTMRHKMHDLNIPCINANHNKIKTDNDRIKKMHKEGISLREIGREMGISYMTVSSRLREIGVVGSDENLHRQAVVRENKKRALNN